VEWWNDKRNCEEDRKNAPIRPKTRPTPAAADHVSEEMMEDVAHFCITWRKRPHWHAPGVMYWVTFTALRPRYFSPPSRDLIMETILFDNGTRHERHDHIVRDKKQYHQKLSYLLRNPVKAGLVRRWQEYEWTYLKGYALNRWSKWTRVSEEPSQDDRKVGDERSRQYS
jgi:hypothetical protein